MCKHIGDPHPPLKQRNLLGFLLEEKFIVAYSSKRRARRCGEAWSRKAEADAEK